MLLLWDITDPAKPRRLGDPFVGHAAAVLSAAFTPDGRTMVTADLLGTILLWDVTDPTRPRRLDEPPGGPTRVVVATAFSPDGALLAAAGGDAVERPGSPEPGFSTGC